MQPATDSVAGLLNLQKVEEDHYLGVNLQAGSTRIYGGQVLAQAISAAHRTLEAEHLAHSLHGYFLRPGDALQPILYQVERTRNGRSFTTRRVLAIQKGRSIFDASISFHARESGPQHQLSMPAAPPPEALMERLQAPHQVPGTPASPDGERRLIESLPIEPPQPHAGERIPPRQLCWIRTAETLPDDAHVQRCGLAYLSDWTLLDTSYYPHGISWEDERVQTASLDHAIWFLDEARADEWLLYAQDSPFSSGARGFNRGLLFNRAGHLVAATAQEGLMRMRGR